jgi:hypothetical protein
LLDLLLVLLVCFVFLQKSSKICTLPSLSSSSSFLTEAGAAAELHSDCEA